MPVCLVSGILVGVSGMPSVSGVWYTWCVCSLKSALSHRLQSRSDGAVRAVAKTTIDASNRGRTTRRLKLDMSKQHQKHKPLCTDL